VFPHVLLAGNGNSTDPVYRSNQQGLLLTLLSTTKVRLSRLLDQELIPYRCSSSSSWGDLFKKSLSLCRFKSDRDEIRQDRSSSKYSSIDGVGYSIRRHSPDGSHGAISRCRLILWNILDLWLLGAIWLILGGVFLLCGLFWGYLVSFCAILAFHRHHHHHFGTV